MHCAGDHENGTGLEVETHNLPKPLRYPESYLLFHTWRAFVWMQSLVGAE